MFETTVLSSAHQPINLEDSPGPYRFTDIVESFYHDERTRNSALALIEVVSELYDDEQTKDVAHAWAVCLANHATVLSIQDKAKYLVEMMNIPRCSHCNKAVIPGQQDWHEQHNCTALVCRASELPLQR